MYSFSNGQSILFSKLSPGNKTCPSIGPNYPPPPRARRPSTVATHAALQLSLRWGDRFFFCFHRRNFYIFMMLKAFFSAAIFRILAIRGCPCSTRASRKFTGPVIEFASIALCHWNSIYFELSELFANFLLLKYKSTFIYRPGKTI